MRSKTVKLNTSKLFAVTILLATLFVSAIARSSEPSDMLDSYDQQVQELYISIYGRPADVAGLNYWSDRIAAAGGDWTADLINDFCNSNEFLERYATLSDEELINSFFNQLFNRPADPVGLEYYVDLLWGTNTSGLNSDLRQSTRSQLALDMLNGALGEDFTTVANKVEIAEYFTQSLEDNGRTYVESNSPDAIELISAVGASEQSHAEGYAQADTLTDELKKPNFQTAHLTRPYYQQFAGFGRSLDERLGQRPELKTIIDQGGFPSALINTLVPDETALNKTGLHALFIGFSTGQVVQVIFEGGIDDFEVIREVNLLFHEDDWERAVTALAYDQSTKYLYAGLGTKVYRSASGRYAPGEWLLLDFSALWEATEFQSGGAIMRFNFTTNQWVEFHPNLVGQSDVLSLYPFTMEDGGSYIATHWGPTKSPQQYYAGFDIIDIGAATPFPVPIPTLSGGDLPDGTYPVVKYFDATPGRGGQGGMKDMFNQALGEPTASTPGKRSDRMYYSAYDNTSIWVRDAVFAEGLGRFQQIFAPRWDKIISLTYTEFNDRAYLLVGNVDGAVQLISLNSDGTFREHREVHTNRDPDPRLCEYGPTTLEELERFRNLCWEPIKDVQVSEDGKEAAVLFDAYAGNKLPDIENPIFSAVRLFSFEHERWLGQLLFTASRGEHITSASRPRQVSGEDSIYKIFIGRENGAVEEYDYRAKVSGELEVVASRELRPHGTRTGVCYEGFYFLVSGLRFYQVDELDYDGTNLIAYTNLRRGHLVSMTTDSVDAGMGIDLYNWSGGAWGEGSGEWSTVSRQKIRFNQASGDDPYTPNPCTASEDY